MKVLIVPAFISRCFMVLCMFGITTAVSAHVVTLRIVTYNIEDDINGATTPLPGLITPSGSTDVTQGGVLEGIGEEILGTDPAQPLDIIALEETTSNPVTVAPIVNGLNTFYGIQAYSQSSYQGTESGGDTADGNGPNAIVYNSATVQLIASVPVDPAGGVSKLGSSSGEYREVMRYEFAPAFVVANASNEFYIYVSHYKSGATASDLVSRGKEAVIIRNDEAANLPANARVLYVGDYNVTTSGEASYITMLATNSPTGIAQGQGFDASNISGSTNVNWGTSTLLSVKTESATDLRYRDDFQIMTSNVYFGTPGGLSLVPGTYHVFGNNGSVGFESSVASGDTALNNDLVPNPHITASALYQDLTTGSDHLPVVADYTITLPDPPTAIFNATPTNGTVPLTVTFTDTGTGIVTNRFWSFGDGSSTNLLTNIVQHIYTNAGVFDVTEIVTGASGTAASLQPGLITVLTPFQAWQLQYFGCTNCPQAQTNADADTTGQNNYFKFIAGLNPTNPAAVFSFQVAPATNLPTAETISFSPAVAGRTYTPQFSTNLQGGAWQPLTNLTPPVTNGTQVTFTDTNAVVTQKFYRLDISLP